MTDDNRLAIATATTLSDLRSLVRWMRSQRGPLFQEWQAGSLSWEDGPLSFRTLLKRLDGSEADLWCIDVFGSDPIEGYGVRQCEQWIFRRYGAHVRRA